MPNGAWAGTVFLLLIFLIHFQRLANNAARKAKAQAIEAHFPGRGIRKRVYPFFYFFRNYPFNAILTGLT